MAHDGGGGCALSFHEVGHAALSFMNVNPPAAGSKEPGDTGEPPDTGSALVTRIPSTEGSWSKADLIRGGWTRTSIKRILGEPDWVIPLKLNAGRPECRYLRSRVEAADAFGPVRYRRARSAAGLPEYYDIYEPSVTKRVWSPWVPYEGDPCRDPSVWLSELSASTLDIASPCFVDRLLFTTEDAVLRVFVHLASNSPWKCLHCGLRCALYDHRPERVCHKAKSEAVSCLMLGRQPRYYCNKHGVRTVPLLSSFENPPAPNGWNRQIEWAIRASI
jgi:hypothetical protein